MVFEGTSWSEGPILTEAYGWMSHPEEFAGCLVYQIRQAGWGATILLACNGRRVVQTYRTRGTNAPGTAFYDYTIDSGMLCGLQPDGRILFTTDLGNWTLLDTGASDGRSIGVLDGTLYVGAMGGDLYRHSRALPAFSP